MQINCPSYPRGKKFFYFFNGGKHYFFLRVEGIFPFPFSSTPPHKNQMVSSFYWSHLKYYSVKQESKLPYVNYLIYGEFTGYLCIGFRVKMCKHHESSDTGHKVFVSKSWTGFKIQKDLQTREVFTLTLHCSDTIGCCGC